MRRGGEGLFRGEGKAKRPEAFPARKRMCAAKAAVCADAGRSVLFVRALFSGVRPSGFRKIRAVRCMGGFCNVALLRMPVKVANGSLRYGKVRIVSLETDEADHGREQGGIERKKGEHQNEGDAEKTAVFCATDALDSLAALKRGFLRGYGICPAHTRARGRPCTGWERALAAQTGPCALSDRERHGDARALPFPA